MQNTFATIKVRNRLCGVVRLKGLANNVIKDVIAEINYSCNSMQVFVLYIRNVKEVVKDT